MLNNHGSAYAKEECGELYPGAIRLGLVELSGYPSVDNPKIGEQPAELTGTITEYQEHARRETKEGARSGLRAMLDSLWTQLDDIVDTAYGLTAAEKAVIHRYPRRVPRVDLLLRQSAPPEDEE